MIETITALVAFITANQFLAGGIGTLLFGAVLFILRGIPTVIANFLARTFTTVLTVNTRNPQFDEVAQLLNLKRIHFLMRSYSPSNEANGLMQPGFGYGWAKYDSTIIVFEKSMLENKMYIEQQIKLRFMTRDTNVIEKFMREASIRRDPENIRIQVSEDGWYNAAMPKKKRDLDTVFIPKTTKDKITEKIDFFVNNEDWYLGRGIPYKLVGIFHGSPGTGKTSLIHAIASKYDFQVNYVTSLNHIDQLIMNSDTKHLLVIEDIDALANDLDRSEDDDTTGKNKNDRAKVIHKLLNSLDGFLTPHGLKVIMTTNFPERLDDALKRPGRTDFIMEIGPISDEDIVNMFESFYGEGSGESLRGIPLGPFTGSFLQELFTGASAVEAKSKLLSSR